MAARRWLVTGSRLPLVSQCPPAGVLPRVLHGGARGDLGSAIHEHVLEDRLRLGIDDAMARLPELADIHELDDDVRGLLFWKCRSFTWCPPRGAVTERALALCADGHVEPVEGGRGVYTKLPEGAILPMQIDAMWAEPEPLYRDEHGNVRCPPESILWCLDLKSGQDRYVEAVERNAQTLAGTVLAARWTGAKKAAPLICFVDGTPAGTWDAPEYYLDEDRLERAHAIVVGWLDGVARASVDLAEGRPLAFHEGAHCTFCDSRSYCSAKTATLKRYLDDPAPLAPERFSPEQASRLAEMLPSIEAFSKSARAALEDYVNDAGRPIVLGNGKLWGPYQKEKADIDGAIAGRALAEEVNDPELVDQAVQPSTTRRAIEAAIREHHRRLKVDKMLGRAMARVMSRIKELGGIQRRTETWWGMYSPKPTEPERRALPQNIPVDEGE